MGEPGGARQRERAALRVYGEKGGLAWSQEDPNYLHFTPFGKPTAADHAAAAPGAGPAAGRVTRIPPGHPEGYLEGFATIYSDVAEQIGRAIEGREPDPGASLVPTVEDGVAGVAFIEAVVASSRDDGAWTAVGG